MVNVFKTLRNHWKKSLVAFSLALYGSKWSYNRYKANEIRHFYCQQALLHGKEKFSPLDQPTRIAVLLNGKANNNKAKSIYDKTVFPLLNLVGLDVRVYRLDNTDSITSEELLGTKIEPDKIKALIIIGGDGTVASLAPHILESKTLSNLPICVIPIGEHSRFFRSLLPDSYSIKDKVKLHDDITLLCESVLALFNGKIVHRPLLKVTLSNQTEPIYASTLQFGYYSQMNQLRQRLWYFNILKYPISSYYVYLTRSKTPLTLSDKKSVIYTKPCSGCLRCRIVEQQTALPTIKPTFFSRLYKSNRLATTPTIEHNVNKEINPDCGVEYCVANENPIEIQAVTTTIPNEIQLNISDKVKSYVYDNSEIEKQSIRVNDVTFYPNPSLSNSIIIDNEKISLVSEEPVECKIQLTNKSLKLIQMNSEPLIKKRSHPPTMEDLDEQELAKKHILPFYTIKSLIT